MPNNYRKYLQILKIMTLKYNEHNLLQTFIVTIKNISVGLHLLNDIVSTNNETGQ